MHPSTRSDAHRTKSNLLASLGCTCTSLLNSLLLITCTGLLITLVLKSGRAPAFVTHLGASSPPQQGPTMALPQSAARALATPKPSPSPPPPVTFSSLQVILGTDLRRVDAQHWVTKAVQELDKKGIKCEGDCSALFGLDFLKNWRGRDHALCKPPPDAAADPTLSKALIHGYTNSHNGKMWMVAEAFNVLLDSTQYSGQVQQDGEPQVRTGALKAACKEGPDMARAAGYPVAQQLKAGLVPDQRDEVLKVCGPGAPKENIVEHPVLLLHRYDTTNAYHNLEDVITAFVALALLDSPGVKSKGVQVVIADGKSLGFYPEFWQRLSHPHQVRFLRTTPYPPNTCFRHIIRTPDAIASLLSYTGVGNPSSCSSPIVVGFAHWLRDAMFPEITQFKRNFDVELQTQKDGQRIVTKTAIWISRRNYEGLASREWNSWQTGRMFNNEHDLVVGLHKAALEWNDQACFRKGRLPTRNMLNSCREKRTVFELQVVELSDVPFYPDQVSKLTRMSILVAAHGAGLANQIWMKPGEGAVIELGHNSGGNLHYENMAHWLSHKYVNVMSGGRDVDVGRAASALKDMMDAIA